MKTYEATIRVRVTQPEAYADMTAVEYLTTHAHDPELGIEVLDIKIRDDAALRTDVKSIATGNAD